MNVTESGRMEQLDLHGDRAALRGNPSFVWRAGQDRRLAMIVRWGIRHPRTVVERTLVDGCGVGMYVRALQPYARETWGIDIEPKHLALARENVPDAHLQLAECENLPFAGNSFDMVLSHEVIEHVRDDAAAAVEMVRVLKPGGRAVVFVPNRWYPFETHGHYWSGVYHFGNTPMINYLPDAARNRLAPHVRAYTTRGLLSLFIGLAVRVVFHTQVMPGFDNVTYRRPKIGKAVRRLTYAMEHTAGRRFGISHLLVIEKVG